MEAGMHVVSSTNAPDEEVGDVTEPAAEKPKARKSRAKPKDEESAAEPVPGAHVGLWVQYCTENGDVIPALLQRQSKTDPSKWDLKISLTGTGIMPARTAVVHAEKPTPGRWNFIPN